MPKKISENLLKSKARKDAFDCITKMQRVQTDDKLKKKAIKLIGDANLSPDIYILEYKNEIERRKRDLEASSNKIEPKFKEVILQKIIIADAVNETNEAKEAAKNVLNSDQMKVVSIAKVHAYRSAKYGFKKNEKVFRKKVESFGEHADLYEKSYHKAYKIKRSKMTESEKVIGVAMFRGNNYAASGRKIFEHNLIRISKSYGEYAELYVNQFKKSYHLKCDKMSAQDKVIALAKGAAIYAARKGYSLSEQMLIEKSEKHGEYANVYLNQYKITFQKLCEKKSANNRGLINSQEKAIDAQVVLEKNSFQIEQVFDAIVMDPVLPLYSSMSSQSSHSMEEDSAKYLVASRFRANA